MSLFVDPDDVGKRGWIRDGQSFEVFGVDIVDIEWGDEIPLVLFPATRELGDRFWGVTSVVGVTLSGDRNPVACLLPHQTIPSILIDLCLMQHVDELGDVTRSR